MGRDLGLGIDTGGTYTDAALIDRASGDVVALSKSPTTPEDFSIGIDGALSQLSRALLAEVSMVALSTTLATNACVENKGGRAAVLLLGYDARLVDRLCAEYGLPRDALHILGGRHDQRGELFQSPDWEAVSAWAARARETYDALGVAEYWGVRNPAMEMRALECFGAVPKAAAHQLTDEINSLKRAATTLLNLRLIPLMDELMYAVRDALNRRNVTAPLWIVRGDGALMSEETAKVRPVEMLLSGPAASAQGGGVLGGLADCVVVDVGGTTSDVAVLRGGRVALEPDGATVGGWRTGTMAAQVRTVGLGGDTRLALNKDGELLLDARRALPLCRLSAVRPELCGELRYMIAEEERRGYSRGEYLMIARGGAAANAREQAVLDALAGGPLGVEALAAKLNTRAYFLDTARLEASGAVLRCALTLTDIWHADGLLSLYDAQAAMLGVRLLAQRLQMEPEALIARATALAQRRMFALLAEHLLSRGVKKMSLGDALDLSFDGTGDEISIRFASALPLVGIGAPAGLLLEEAAARLGTRAVVPKHALVGGAVGAVSGLVAAEVQAVVRPVYEPWGIDGYACHTPDGRTRFETLEEAKAAAEAAAVRAAGERAARMGAQRCGVSVRWQERIGKPSGREAAPFLLEAVVVARAAGKAGG